MGRVDLEGSTSRRKLIADRVASQVNSSARRADSAAVEPFSIKCSASKVLTTPPSGSSTRDTGPASAQIHIRFGQWGGKSLADVHEPI